MCQFDGDVLVDSVSVLISGRVVDRSISRARISQETEVPAVREAENQFSAIKIPDQHPIPGTGVDRPVSERDAGSVDIAKTGRVGPDLLNDVDEISNEDRTRPDRHLVTQARSRRGSGSQVSNDVRTDISNDFLDNVDGIREAEVRTAAGRAGREGLGRGVEVVDERPVNGVAVDLELHRNLRTGPRLDRKPPGQEAAVHGGRDRLTE